jgi:hypothetical protein
MSDPYPDFEPFPFADLFVCGWVETDLTPEGGAYGVVCLGCHRRVTVRGKPTSLPAIAHKADCVVAAYIENPEGGMEGRARVHRIIRNQELPPIGGRPN